MIKIIRKALNIIEKLYYLDEICRVNKGVMVDGYESPEPGDLPKKGVDILATTYASCRKDGGGKEKCSKIAWGAVNRWRDKKGE